MVKFKVGDKVKVVSTRGMLGERLPVIGNIYKIVRVSNDSKCFKVEGFDVTGNWMNSDCVAIPANDSPKEITLNGATYVLKEEHNAVLYTNPHTVATAHCPRDQPSWM